MRVDLRRLHALVPEEILHRADILAIAMLWAEVLATEMKKRGKTAADAQRDRKGAVWKAEIAQRLKDTTQAGNRWLAEQLKMGRPEAVGVYVGRLRIGENARTKAK